MFTGIVQAVAEVAALRTGPSGGRLELEGKLPWALEAGESVAVDGCCLTALPGAAAAFDLSPETLARTTLGARAPGDRVNLERALRVGDALGGHFMSGHVDGRAELLWIRAEGGGALWRLRAPAGWERLVASKGSLALDGVSLTPFDVSGREFSVALIPHTLAATGLGRRRAGDGLNFEADALARYVARLLEAPGGES